MLSFEEFFHKKKIDLTALKAGEPTLYAEFSRHYAEMGEKSFDHTKKFWFNKLRKNYLIAAGEPAPIPEKPLATSDIPVKPVSEVVPVEPTAAAVKPAGFKPRFKAGAAKVTPKPVVNAGNDAASATEKSVESVPSKEGNSTGGEQPQLASKPAGFKPRFKAGATKTVAESPDAKADKIVSTEAGLESKPPIEEKPVIEEQPQPANKPAGFKPRFKAGATKTISTELAKPEAPSDPASATEPTKDKEPSDATAETSLAENNTVSPSSEEDKPSTDEPPTTTNKPAGFKPRFKAGLTKSNKPKDDQ
ncbi:hypothetical protein M8998_11455 [Sphingobacterium sp. lm-10]|uniref:hypothetical protein n=1 Tax=Sphingobacterium sp. lm-10 TaxID=2944904 RepID=UPI002021E174|nr:hypothetical protein [Sphingobacterium sp. lm-10]MCL7988553.1 hypothetical protein [Sphingobacterium sp. lm-10]